METWTGKAGYQITKDEKTQWPGKFDWKVTHYNWDYRRHLNMGWFGSFENAQKWILRMTQGVLAYG